MKTAVSGLIVAALLVATGCGSDPNELVAPRSQPLLEALETTIIGQTIVYPEGQAQVTSAVLTFQPGEQTGWHHHDAPLYAYILSGAVTVDYGPDGTRTYIQGEAFVEALGTSHNGMTAGDEPVEILAVFVGAEGVSNTVLDD